MKRRAFLALLSVAAAWSPAAHAQQTVPVVGVLSSHTPVEWRPFVAAFNEGLKDVGYVDGQNISTEYRWAEGHYARLPVLAADLVRHKVAVISVRFGSRSTLHFSNGPAADCLERHTRGETVSGLIGLVRQASGRDALRQVSRSGSTGKRGRPAT
jgi:putative tryptophan/tyrosine transport system substrate-binding protein